MNTNKHYRLKVHVFFGGTLLLVLFVSVTINFFSGQAFLWALIDAFRQIRPMEYAMFFLFWYWFARGQNTNSRPRFMSLNLGPSKT